MSIFSRKVQDLAINPIPFALPAASASTNSTSINIDGGIKTENMEFEISIPALAVGVIPDASVVSLILETSTTSNFAAIVATQTQTVTGAGGVGIPATSVRFRVQSNCPSFVRFKVTRGAGGTTASAFNGTGTVRF
jgi:hypothetical protein